MGLWPTRAHENPLATLTWGRHGVPLQRPTGV